MGDGTYRGWWIDQVFRTPQISDAVRVALLALAADMDAAGRVSLPRNAIAERLGRSERRITDRLKAGIEAGFLQRATRGQKGRTAVYQAVTPAHLSGTPGCPPDGFQGDGLQHPEEAQRDTRVSSREKFSGTPGGPTTYRANADTSDHGPDAVVVDLFNEEKNKAPSRKRSTTRKRAATSANGEHPAFADWYAAYPLHKARGAAVKAFTKAAAKVDDPKTLIAAAQKYRDHDERVARGYIKNPATWLNQECWLDEPAPPASQAAASGEYRPYTNPTDQSVYYEDL